MTRWLVISYLSLTIVVVAMLEVPLGFVNARGERAQLSAKVERDAVAVASLAESTVEGDTATSDLPALKALARRYVADTGGRIVIVDKKGVALVDSTPLTLGRRTFATRPEIRAALNGDVATGVRSSSTLGHDILYVGVPIASGGVIHGAVRVTYPMSEVDRRVRNYWLALAGILAGLALGTKTLAIVAPIFLAGALLLNRQQTVFRRLREAALVIGICIIIASPWYVKSWIWTGNPTYPFFYSTFGGRYWSAAAAQSYREAQLAYGVGATHVDYMAGPWREIHRVGPGAWLREGPFEFLVLPWNLTLHTASFADPPGLLSPLNVHLISLGPLFLALLPLAFLAGGLGPRHRFWLWFSLVFLIFWFAAAQIMRYMIPVLPALALGLAGALLALRERQPWLGRLIAIPVALGLIGSAATAYAFNADSFRVALGLEARADYLRRTLGPYAIMEYANMNLPADAKLLLLEEPRGFYLDRPYMWGGGQNQMIAGPDYSSADTLLRALARYHINYVLMAPSFLRSLATGQAPLERAFRQAWQQGYLRPVRQDSGGRVICRVEEP